MFEHSTAAKNIQVTTMEGDDAEALDALTNDWLSTNKEVQVYNITFNNAEQPTVMIVHEPI